MATLLKFPGTVERLAPLPQPPQIKPALSRPLPATGGHRGEYALADVARSLGLLHFGIRTIVDKLRKLAAHDGMPLPRTPRFVGAEQRRGPLTIYSKSRWDAGEFDAWVEAGRNGPVGGAAAPKPLPRPIADEMARRADQLGKVA